MVTPLVMRGCAILAMGLLAFQQVAKPRLPLYKLRVNDWPGLRWVKDRGWMTRLPTKVQVFNENYLAVDVHALTFDLYASNGGDGGQLSHIGTIIDGQQVSIKKLPVEISATENNTFFALQSNSTKPPNLQQVQAMWKLSARSNFETDDVMYLDCYLKRILQASFTLISQWWRGGGLIILPCSGVAHIKASSRARFTVSMVCDNLINTWTMQVNGLECTLQKLQSGWIDLDGTAQALRAQSLQRMRAHPITGGVLQHPTKSWKDTIHRIAWEESMQILG